MGSAKPSAADTPYGVPADGAQRSNGSSTVKKAITKLRVPSEATLKLLKKAKWRVGLSFFVVGMSMATFIASAIQCLDYLEAQYQELNVKKIIDTGYSFGFFVVAAQFFFKGKPDTSSKPRQRKRLIMGILIQMFALILPIVVDTIFQESVLPKLPELLDREEVAEAWMNDPAKYWENMKNKNRLWMLQSLMAIPWAIAAMLAGGSDGLLSVVIFAEAKAVKGDKAAQYGRVFIMLFMPALRCITKAIIISEAGGNAVFDKLNLEPLSRLRISAAAHVGMSFIILLVCLLLVTYVVPKEVAVMQESGQPLNAPPALNMGATLQTAIDAEEDSPEGDEAKASMQAGGSLAAMNPAADAAYVTPLIEIRGFSFKWLKPAAAADPDTPAPPVNLKPTDSIMAGVNHQPTMRRFVDTHRASMMSRRMDSLKVPAGTSPLGTPRASGAGPITQLTSAGSVKDVENPSSAHTEAETEAIRARARMRRLGSLSSTASGDFRQRPGQSGDVQVIVNPAKEAGNNFVLYDTDSSGDQPSAYNKDRGLSGVSEGDEKGEDGGKHGDPFPPYPVDEPVKEKPKDQGAEMSLGTKLKCCWEAAIGVWPFILICFVMPMVNSQLMQLAQQPEFGNTAYGRTWKAMFYIQCVEFAKVLGGFGGSLFFHQVRRVWVMVLMAGIMLLFLPAWGLSYFCHGGPAVKIVLAFVMCTYSGYLNSVAKGTSSKRRPAEERWIQMVLSLVSAAAFFCGNVIGWSWTAAPERGAPWHDPDEWAQQKGACRIWYKKP